VTIWLDLAFKACLVCLPLIEQLVDISCVKKFVVFVKLV
jgi:hypothetical protein